MKTTLLICICLLPLFTLAQIDETRNHELRISFLGNVTGLPNIAPEIQHLGKNSKLSLTYLKRHKETRFFYVGEVNGLVNRMNHSWYDNNIGNTLWYNLGGFLGVEHQYQFKHFGTFLSAGLVGSFLNYKGDFTLPDRPVIRDFSYRNFQVGPSGRLVLYTNILSNAYIFLNTSLDFILESSTANQSINEIPLDETFINTRMNLNALGVAFKF
ncbi:hypothetical protein [Portibacter marinus]|uniref:hypothetical protein n=1 Tax=Portibacter marinus TaxID=2898660 RepID=UPI001F3A0893|nr:hypothetical protein [Portibacter marinus]